MNNRDFFRKLELVRKLTYPLNQATHHSEKAKVKLSWLYPLFSALLRDEEAWTEHQAVRRYFSAATINDVREAVLNRWVGRGQTIAVKSSVALLANVLDPYTQPVHTDLPEDWLEECEQVLGKFYSLETLERAMDELKRLILREG